tara:strand:+ start:1317 stop:1928 length:612 start_codon:yes stop_codon:yes gene_type:complete
MKIFINTLSRAKQIILIEHLRNIINYAPFFRPYFPIWNTPFRIQITNAGDWGWISDKNGYRYCKTHPKTNDKWPNIPEPFLKIWDKYTSHSQRPNCSLINLYDAKDSRLGLHQDKDEVDFSNPVLFISLGSKAIFNYGIDRKNLKKITLTSGSIIILENKSRLYYHSISRILDDKKNIFKKITIPGIPDNSRICISLRRFTQP